MAFIDSRMVNGPDGKNVFDSLNEHAGQLADNAKKTDGLDTVDLLSDGTDQASKVNTYLTNLGTGKRTLFIRQGTYDINSNVTIPSNVILTFAKDAKFRINTGAILEIKGLIINGNNEIFVDGGGTVKLDNSPNEYNLGWFGTTNGYINERWLFAKRGMASFRRKIIRVPKPYEGQSGVYSENGRLYWLFSDEIKIEDNQNTSTWYLDGEFRSNGNCTNFMNFEDPAKPEDIHFYGDLLVSIPAGTTVQYGINIKSAARIHFYGEVVVNGAQTNIKLGGTDQVAPVSDIRFLSVNLAFFYQSAFNIYGKAVHTVQNIIVDNLVSQTAQSAGLNVVEIKGLIRNVKIGNVYYITDTAKNGYTANDAQNVVYIESNSEGDIIHVEVDSIYQANALNGLKTNSIVSDNSKIRDVVVSNIFGKYHADAVILDWCKRVNVLNIENEANVTLNTNAIYCGIIAGSGLYSYSDSGSYNTLNNLGKQSRGAGVAPAPSVAWSIGNLIRETTDGKVYLRVANTGAASDFVVLN